MRRWLYRAALAVTLALVMPAAAPAVWAQSSAIYVVQRGDTLFKIARANGLTVAQLKALNGLSTDVISVGQQLAIAPLEGATPRPMQGAVLPSVPAAQPPGPAEEPAPTAPPTPTPAPLEDEYADEPADVGPSVIVATGGREIVLNPPDPIPTGPPPPPPPPATISRVRIGAGTSGQVILSQRPVGGEEATQVHVVQPGETLFAIARRYGTTVDALRQRNGLRGDALAVGQRLTVAGAAQPVAPVVLPTAGRPYDVTQTTVGDDQVHTVVRGETLYDIAARYGTTVSRLLAVNTLTTAPLPAGTLVALPDSVGIQHYRQPAPPPPADETGLALVYPDSYRGRETISGEPYDPAALTASHRTLPFGTVLLVTMPATGRSTLVRVNDRGPVSEGFLIELSEAAAAAIGQNAGAAEKVDVRIVQ